MKRKNTIIKILVGTLPYLILLLIFIGAIINALNNKTERIKTEQVNNLKTQIITLKENCKTYKENINDLTLRNSKLLKYEKLFKKLENVNIHTDTRYYDIPLTFSQQKFVQEVAEKYGLCETLGYGVMHKETGFDNTLVNEKEMSIGAFQLREKYLCDYSEIANLEIYDVYKFEDNITMGFAYLAYLKNYYIQQGYTSQEDLTYITLLAYNRGIGGAKDYIEKHGTIISDYANVVLAYKCEIEQNRIEGSNE